MRVSFWLPKVPEGAGMNFLGFAGLITAVVAVGALAGSWWWSALAGGLVAVSLSVWSQYQAEMERRESVRTSAAPAAAKTRTRPTIAEDAAA